MKKMTAKEANKFYKESDKRAAKKFAEMFKNITADKKPNSIQFDDKGFFKGAHKWL